MLDTFKTHVVSSSVHANYEPKTDQFKSFQRIVTPMGRDFMGATSPYAVGENQSDNANVEGDDGNTDMSADNDGPAEDNASEDVPSQKDTMDDATRALEREQAKQHKQEQEGK